MIAPGVILALSIFLTSTYVYIVFLECVNEIENLGAEMIDRT